MCVYMYAFLSMTKARGLQASNAGFLASVKCELSLQKHGFEIERILTVEKNRAGTNVIRKFSVR